MTKKKKKKLYIGYKFNFNLVLDVKTKADKSISLRNCFKLKN